MAITAHVYQTFIRATPEQVWQAITDPAWTQRYFHGTAPEQPFEAGQPYRTTVVAAGQPAVDGMIEEMDPPHRLVQTWHVLYDAAMAQEPPSRVTWEIDPVGDGLTRLRLVHGDLAFSPKTWANVKDGWVWVLDSMKSLIETGQPLPRITDPSVLAAADPVDSWHRAQGVEANNSIWDLVAKADRTSDDDEELVRRAYAAAYHWDRADRRGPESAARAAYMIAKAQLAVGQPQLSLAAADRCMATCVDNAIADFDLAYAHEARARALQALGRAEEAAAAWTAAHDVPIADDDDRKILDEDLAVPLA
jgi:uncharacterized protein YndB with AHSA1/START domain